MRIVICPIMKKLIFLIISLVFITSCDKYEYDDSAIWEHLAEIGKQDDMESLCNRLNTNINSLCTVIKALQQEDYVKNITAMVDGGVNAGYVISFENNGSVPIYLNLNSGNFSIPDLGLKADDKNFYYWTLYSAWLLDENGQKINSAPKLKIESGHWYLSSDEGNNWEQLEEVENEKYAMQPFLFADVDLSSKEYVVLTLSGGYVISLPIKQECDGYDPWDGYLDPDVYEEQDMINLTNVLMANMNNCNLATRHLVDIAYNFWKRRNEFIYCSQTALDSPWDYWSYVGFKDGNTGFIVEEGHGGYKRIDCSTFVRYVVNGIDYYSTPYYNALEWTNVVQGALNSKGANASSSDKNICRSGKIYLRHGKKHILESANSSKYRFTKIFAYDSSGKMVKDLTGKSSFTLPSGAEYIRVEMKVNSASAYASAVEGKSPAAILKCLRIREDERLEVAADCPDVNRRAHTMSRWFDENGYGLKAYEDYNPLYWEDSDFKPGTVVFMGKKSAKSEHKGITHVTLYIGSGYIIHSQAPRGLLGGEGIMIDKLRDMEMRYDRPFCSAASPKYHSNYDEEKSQLN